jgi:hypothetical protein
MLDVAARIENQCIHGPIGKDFENIVIPLVSRGGSFQVKLVRGTDEKDQLDLPTNADISEGNGTQEIYDILEESAASTPPPGQQQRFARCPKKLPRCGHGYEQRPIAKYDNQCQPRHQLLGVGRASESSWN